MKINATISIIFLILITGLFITACVTEDDGLMDLAGTECDTPGIETCNGDGSEILVCNDNFLYESLTFCDTDSEECVQMGTEAQCVPLGTQPEVTPQPDTTPLPDNNPQPDTSPQPDTNPTPDTNPQPDEDPTPDTNPQPDEDPTPDTNPQPDEDPTPDTNPQPDEDPTPDTNPQPDEDPTPDTNPQPDEDTTPDTNPQPDEDPTPDTNPQPDEDTVTSQCQTTTFSTINIDSETNIYFNQTLSVDGAEMDEFQLFFTVEGVSTTDQFPLNGINSKLETCEACLLIASDIVEDNVNKFYMPTSGTFGLSETGDGWSEGGVFGTITNAVFEEVTIEQDATTNEVTTTYVQDGNCIEISHAEWEFPAQ